MSQLRSTQLHVVNHSLTSIHLLSNIEATDFLSFHWLFLAHGKLLIAQTAQLLLQFLLLADLCQRKMIDVKELQRDVFFDGILFEAYVD